MDIIIAKSAGFCFGVKKAVETVEKSISEYSPLYTFGEIIHNPQVVLQLKERGVNPIESVDAIQSGTVIIRSHGAPKLIFDKFEQKNIKIIDATCPFVARIQKIVQKALQKDEFIVIIGEESHPEVIGISGHCENKAVVVNEPNEANKIKTDKNVCVVAQTTTRRDLYNNLTKIIKDNNQSVQIFDTICDATAQRQSEAEEIAAKVDKMIVIGGRQSSNTAKLFAICSEKCKNTYAVEKSDDVLTLKLNKNDIIGVTAGASTPDWLIKEVVDRMSEIMTEEFDFAKEMEKALSTIRPGRVISGKVIEAKPEKVTVNIGYKSDGIISSEDLAACGESFEKFASGDDIEVEVVKINDGDGNVILSRKKIVLRAEADKALGSISNGEIFEVTVSEAVKGGLTAEYNGLRVFIPRSQIRANGFVKNVDEFVGKTLRVRAIDIDEKYRKVVATHGAIIQEERQAAEDAAWAKLEEGATVKGVVRRLTDFGAFVDLGGVDGLVHITDIAWYRIAKPADVLSVGQEIDVKILKLDRENNRISLSYKELQPQPWEAAEAKYAVDTVVKGTVVRLTTFGAFVALEPGIDGLVHISELSNKYITKVEEAVKVGQEIEALVLEVDTEKKRISLSIKALIPEEELVEEATEEVAEEAEEAVEE